MILIENCPLCGNNKFTKYISAKDYFLTNESFSINKCKECNFLFTNPRPEDKELSKYYKSSEYLSHSKKINSIYSFIYGIIRKISVRRKFRLINKLMKNEGSLLDFGCGSGEFLSYCSKKSWKTAGVEPDEDARNIAGQQIGMEVFESLEELGKINDRKFDVITLWHVLEHVPEIDTRIDELKKILKYDGSIIIALPNPMSWDAKHYGKYWAAYDLPRHLYHFTQQTVKRLLIKHNFKLLSKQPMRFDAYYVSLLSEKYISGYKNYFKAAKSGYLSNKKAKKTGNYSSLIYIFKLADK